MRRADEKLKTAGSRRFSALHSIFVRAGVAISLPWDMSVRKIMVASTVALVATTSFACSPGPGFSPAGAQNPSDSTDVTVPDEISRLDSEEVERRLGRLLGGEVTSGQAAPGVEPTETPDGPTLAEILELLNSSTPVPSSGEIVISISPETLKRFDAPVLTIKSPPSHGSATVMSAHQILYMPDGSGDGTDAFEYELFDGDESVVSQVMEIRR